LHRHIRVSHTHSLGFVWLTVNVPLPIHQSRTETKGGNRRTP
jgi:hypothetical protein